MLVQECWWSQVEIDASLLIPMGTRVHEIARRILQLVMDVLRTFLGFLLAYTRIAHRPNQLAYNYGIADRNMSSMGMNNFVHESIRVPDCDSTVSALACICHNAGYGRSQRRVRKIDPLCPGTL